MSAYDTKTQNLNMYFLTYCPRGGKIIKIIHLFVLYGFLYIRHFSLSELRKGRIYRGGKRTAPVRFCFKVKTVLNYRRLIKNG